MRRQRLNSPQARGPRPFRGFSLIEMSVVLVILGLIALAAVALLPQLTDRMRLDTATGGLEDASEAIVGFAVENHRLPCPDIDGNGTEGAAGSCLATHEVGTIPYRSLGLHGPVVDQARLQLRYGVYRNAGANADLATLSNLFEPTLPGTLAITPGEVSFCGEVLADTIQIVYANGAENVLTVTPTSGNFAVGDYVSGSTLDYNNITPNTPTTYPSCACGTVGLACAQCTDFVAGETIFLSGQTATDIPNAEIDSLSGSRLILPFPVGTFSVGNTIEGEDSGVTADVTAFYFPGTAKIESIITAGQVFTVSLIPTASVFFSDPNFGFLPGHLLFSSGGDEATYVNLAQDQQSLFQIGETITGGGASGTIDADTGTTLTVTGVSGTFSVGDTIVGSTSGADADIVSITEDVFAEPDITYGSITIPDPNVTASGEMNELDFCKALRNGTLAADSAGDVHTLNTSSVVINPAYLVVSGGVEDAIPGDTAFDGLNEGIATVDFNSPALGRNATYDDLVRTTPMQRLDQRLSCPRKLGTVNAAAVSAMVAQNIAISSYNNNENALSAIQFAYAGLQLAIANVAIEAALTALAAAECAKGVTEAVLTKGGSALAAAAACVAAAGAVVNFAFAVDALNEATGSYNFACSDQLDAASELFAAETAAAAALALALEADQKGGTR
ncbi:MAG: prepilin-type N-terminal cleavage/methylation domain-containing protein [Gammaproteobacteria bacterium]|nr:prepilin-type N-terminal cleavage/methylation domain-containing protein [Gammaproteobacteria bacterium]